MIMKKNIPNNNQSVITLLVSSLRKSCKGRNRILAATVACAVLVLCTVFSVTLGKIDAEYIQAARASGTVANTYLERGTMEQYKQLKALPYIKNVGRSKTAAYGYKNGTFICTFTAMDKVAWEIMTVPAYTDIVGHYPTADNEIMLPVRALEQLGISHPKEGMDIHLEVTSPDDSSVGELMDFTLCGWYTDYVDPLSFPAVGYISHALLEQWGMNLDSPDEIMIMQQDTMDGYSVEDRLYDDVAMVDSSQQFLGGNSHSYDIMNDFIGGYKMAAICSAIILICVCLLVQNILSISLHKDIRQIGLLTTIGATKKQIQRVYYKEIGQVMAIGLIAGCLLSIISVLGAVPYILGGLYLYNFGKSAELMAFRPEVFLFAIIFTGLVTGAAVALTVHRATGFTPLKALHYTGELGRYQGQDKIKLHVKPGKPGYEMALMARKNLLRYKKRFSLTIISLFLGIMVALASMVINAGTDMTNEINKHHDFQILTEPPDRQAEHSFMKDDGFSPIGQDILNNLLSIKGIDKTSILLIQGAYMNIPQDSDILKPLLTAEESSGVLQEKGESEKRATIQIVDNKYMIELEKYIQKNNLPVDINALKEGSGVFLLHHHQLSPVLTKEAENTIGLPITFQKLASDSAADRLIMGGYLDEKAKGFPVLTRTWHGPDILYFLISKEGFKKLNTSIKTFQVQLNAKKEFEPSARFAIKKLLSNANITGVGLKYVLLSKSEEMEAEQSYIKTNKIIMNALSIVLIVMGLVNYFNVMSTSFIARQKEFAIMETVGTTAKQLKRMLILEGIYYYSIVVLLLLTLGTGVLKLISYYMNSKIKYFEYYYPYIPLIIMLIILLIICIGIPILLYRHIIQKSLVERTRTE